MARRSSQPRELVRLSPLQFSLSVSIVVVLLGGAALGGYYYGLKRTTPGEDETYAEPSVDQAEVQPVEEGAQTAVTFYSTLTEPRKDLPTAGPPPSAGETRAPVKTGPPEASSPDSGIRDPSSGGGTVLLQVASYKDAANARKLLEELTSDGYAGTVVRADLGERGVWFRVRIGPYKGGEEAKEVLESLRRERRLKGYAVKQ